MTNPQWLDVRHLDYQGQHSPPNWHNALVAVATLRPPTTISQPPDIVWGWEQALRQVHNAITRELGITP